MAGNVTSALVTAAAVGAGGFVGALARHATASLSAGAAFPWGTLCANLIGCFLIGLAKSGLERAGASPVASLALVTGFLGAYTTFSTFTFDTLTLGRNGAARAVVYVLVSVLGGLALCALGIRLASAR